MAEQQRHWFPFGQIASSISLRDRHTTPLTETFLAAA
jgi:hypothetical protein